MGRKNNGCDQLRGGGNRPNKAEERSTKAMLKKAKEKVMHSKKKDLWRKDLQRFKEQLQVVGFDLKEIPGDGNCLFRALGDQIEGAQDKHEYYRARVVNFIRDNREQFEPFIIDMSFDAYCKQMSTVGSWGGNIELQAASLALQVNITVHQLDHPQWQILNFFDGSPMIHLSYHDGQHYNSLRPMARLPEGKPSIHIQKAVNAGKQACLDKEKENKVKIAMQSTGYTDKEVATEILRDCEWDLDAAIEILITMKQVSSTPEVPDVPASVPDTSQPMTSMGSNALTSISTSTSPSLTDDTSLLSNYLHELSIYDEESALTASLIEYELALAESAAMASSAPTTSSTQAHATHTTPSTSTSSTTTTTTTTSNKCEPSDAEHNKARSKKSDLDDIENKPQKPRQNKKQTQKEPARKLSNKERKLANKKMQEESRREQKKLDMQRLMDELHIASRETHGDDDTPTHPPVADLGVVLI